MNIPKELPEYALLGAPIPDCHAKTMFGDGKFEKVEIFIAGSAENSISEVFFSNDTMRNIDNLFTRINRGVNVSSGTGPKEKRKNICNHFAEYYRDGAGTLCNVNKYVFEDKESKTKLRLCILETYRQDLAIKVFNLMKSSTDELKYAAAVIALITASVEKLVLPFTKIE